jgi:hypothetical protein
MDAATAVGMVSTVVAAVIAVTVPFMAFRLALRQDSARWLREQRAQLYVDLLAEAHAEQEYLKWAMADDQTRESARSPFQATDTRLAPAERARLGARGTIFGSNTANGLFNQMMAEMGRATLGIDRLHPDASRMHARVRVGGLLDELEAAVRRELGADRIQLNAAPPAGGTAARERSGPGAP